MLLLNSLQRHHSWYGDMQQDNDPRHIDLPNGGIDLPCFVVFKAKPKETLRVKFSKIT